MKWVLIHLPALAEDDDILGRERGEALWPEWFPKETLEDIKAELGSRHWNSLYQQRPAPEEGAIFLQEYWKFYDPYRNMPQFDKIIQSWDMSFKSDGGSYVVGQVWGAVQANRYLIKQVREKMDFAKTVKSVQELTAWVEDTFDLSSHYKLVERAANGYAIVSQLQNEIGGIVSIKPLGSKEARAQAVLPTVEAGNVYLPCHPPDGQEPAMRWAPSFVQEFIYEATAFPYGTNDDQVDAMSQALNFLKTKSGKSTKRNSFSGAEYLVDKPSNKFGSSSGRSGRYSNM